MISLSSIKKIFFMLIILTMVPLVIMAQTGAADESIDVVEYIASIPGLAALVLLVTQFLKQFLKTDGWYSAYLSWIVALVLSVIGWSLQLGIFLGATWYIVLIYAAAAGLIANGLFDWKMIKAVLELLKLLPPEKVRKV